MSNTCKLILQMRILSRESDYGLVTRCVWKGPDITEFQLG